LWQRSTITPPIALPLRYFLQDFRCNCLFSRKMPPSNLTKHLLHRPAIIYRRSSPAQRLPKQTPSLPHLPYHPRSLPSNTPPNTPSHALHTLSSTYPSHHTKTRQPITAASPPSVSNESFCNATPWLIPLSLFTFAKSMVWHAGRRNGINSCSRIAVWISWARGIVGRTLARHCPGGFVVPEGRVVQGMGGQGKWGSWVWRRS